MPTSDRVLYLDTSAFLKAVFIENESGALRDFASLTTTQFVSSELLETEARRAALRLDTRWLTIIEYRLENVTLIAITRDVLVMAGRLQPAGLRSLDAIHLATALSLGASLNTIITYDRRMATAATSVGLSVSTPS